MKKILFLSFLSLVLISCEGTRPTVYTKKRGQTSSTRVATNHPPKATTPKKQYIPPRNIPDLEVYPETEIEDVPIITSKEFVKKMEIIDFAKTFQGTRYKFGGTTRSGMDCSGLICTAFQKEQISLPRSSRDMATQGFTVNLRHVEPGDLVFFKTNGKKIINHVGLVVEAENGNVKFIHSTVTAGVIISSLDENYWKRAFVEARRVI